MNFNELYVNKQILKGIEKMGFDQMTEIQEKVIPLAILGQDILGQAPTGTGKTLAYAIPILECISLEIDKIQAIVIAPTRELVVQITKEINEVAVKMKDVKALAIYGGESIDKQITSLKKKPKIIVATPGRLMDHMRRKTIKLDNIRIVTLDEADEMLNMGFKEDIDLILEGVNTEHQTLLFSATFSEEIENIARNYMVDAEKIHVKQKSLTVSLIDQYFIELSSKDKIEAISRIIDINDYQLSMIFCNTKRSVDDVTSGLLTRGYMAEALHGDMKQMQRDRVMERFRSGRINVLVASDVAARGLDIDDVEIVFNYDLPTDEEYYVHRIGRTGRAKKQGVAISLVDKKEKFLLRRIINYTKAEINKMTVPALDSVISVRTKRILDEAINSAKEKTPYDSIINKQLNNIDDINKDMMIKGLINLLINSNDSSIEIEEVKEEIKSRKSRYSHNDVRCFISIGKRDKIKVYDIADMLCDKTNLSNSEINAIDLHDSFSFFEVPNEYIDEVIALDNNVKIKGKLVSIEIANPKRKDSKSNKNNSKNVSKNSSNKNRSSERKDRKFDKQKNNNKSSKKNRK